ncbi:LysE family translocator [Methanoregula sp. UBA64]|uniref:LysE family translocator n=1 Tax=Methanoregula sp. UBA64 TaxID=1915554 RepID=UPI0025ECF74E|nr:LysE family transporter [Methanoregula sp. UBA64]
MDWSVLVAGIIFGFCIAAPVGPIAILCIRRTLACGWRSGIATGLGAATADGVYAGVAAFGLTVVTGLLTGHMTIVSAVGGALLVGLGVRIFLSAPPDTPGTAGECTLLQDYATTVFLTLTNPMTLISFAGVFAALGIGGLSGGGVPAMLMVLGITAGSIAWWILLVSGTSVLGSRCDSRVLGLVNRVAGVIIVLFGIATFAMIFV